ncbi:MAG: rod shape-determining protein [Candidatus Caldatribacteriota bacterium]
MWGDFIFRSFSKYIGIDLGTSTTLVWLKNKGLVLYEPSVVAIQEDRSQVLTVGEEAKKMIGRTPRGLMAIRPLKEGVIADFNLTAEMLKYFIKKVHLKTRFIQPTIVICVPSGVTEVEKRAVSEVAYQCGAQKVFLIDEPMAAAIGVGLPIFEPMGNLIMDIGGGTSETAVISLGGIVVSELSKVAGDYLNATIEKYIKQSYDLYIGELTSENLKISLSRNVSQEEDKTFEISGRDRLTGMPKIITIPREELRYALNEPIRLIANTVRLTLEKTPPELVADILDKGLIMTGGGSLLSGLAEFLQEEMGIATFISSEAEYCVINGIGKVLNDLNYYQRILLKTSK